jgi:hypothetical protein
MAHQIIGNATSETVTRSDIVELRTVARMADDDDMDDICGRALEGDEDSIRHCERAIAHLVVVGLP